MRIDYHRTLIADHVRNAALTAALAAVIVPGRTVVADIGTGTGLLGLIAARLGARKVYMYEVAAVGAVAAEIVRANRWAGGVCEVLGGDSRDMIDPPRADVVISETLGNYAFEEGIVATLGDAVARHLAPGGVVIPSAVTQSAAPVVTPRIHRELAVWDGVGDRLGLGPIDLGIARTMSANNAYVRPFDPADLLDGGRSAVAWDTVDVARSGASSSRKGEMTWRLPAGATVYGFAVWWTATLVPATATRPAIVLSTAPDAPRTHWEQLYFPLRDPVTATVGTSITLAIRSRTSAAAGTHLAWTAVHLDSSGRRLARYTFDLDKGYLP
jgi:protein arginine N-methyltransferase 1